MKKKNNKLYYFVVGEPSGDLHASNLIRELKKQSGANLSFRGLGGPLMQKEGLVSIESFERLAVMGFVEIIKELFFFLKLQKKIVEDIKMTCPDKIILVDYPGFNLRLSKSLRAFYVLPIVYYISPQFWAWKEKRIKYIKKYISDLVVIFPFEVPWYKKRNIKVHYFGHPLVDLYQKKPIKNKSVCVGLFLGSRKQEIKNHSPVIKKVIVGLQKKINDVFFVIGSLKKENEPLAEKLGLKNNYKIVCDSFQAFDESDVAIVASGTATLECAITKTPFVVIYKTSFVSWVVTSLFVKVKFASIVNILAKKLLVREFLQKECQAQTITNHLINLIENNNQSLYNDFEMVVKRLGDGVAYKKTAGFLLLK